MFSTPSQRNFSVLPTFSLLSVTDSIWTSLKFCSLIKSLLFTTQSRLLTTSTEKPFENIFRKGNQHFLLFPQCFLPFRKQVLIFLFKFILSSANAFNLDQSKILLFGKELRDATVTHATLICHIISSQKHTKALLCQTVNLRVHFLWVFSYTCSLMTVKCP